MGLVSEVFRTEAYWLSRHIAIGHVRSSLPSPVYLLTPAFAFPLPNGHLAIIRTETWLTGQHQRQLEEEGSIFQSTTDSEVIAHLIARSGLNDTRKRC